MEDSNIFPLFFSNLQVINIKRFRDDKITSCKAVNCTEFKTKKKIRNRKKVLVSRWMEKDTALVQQGLLMGFKSDIILLLHNEITHITNVFMKYLSHIYNICLETSEDTQLYAVLVCKMFHSTHEGIKRGYGSYA